MSGGLKSNERLDYITGEILFYKRIAGNAFYEIGKFLIEAKKLLKHGEWLTWLSESVRFSESSANRFMRVAREFDEETVRRIGISKALALLRVPTEKRSDFITADYTINGEKRTFESLSKREFEKVLEGFEVKKNKRRINMSNMLLKNTVEMMNSKDYKERFRAEYLQTKIKYERLKAFCNKIEAANASPERVEKPAHDCPLYMLREQERVMRDYLAILEVRAVIEGVEL